MIVNGPVTILLRSPLHGLLSRKVLLLTVSGRRTGRRYVLPAQYAARGERVYVLPGRPEAKTWWRNLVEPAPVTVLIRGVEHTGEGEALTGDAAGRVRDAFAGTAMEPIAQDPANDVIVEIRDLQPPLTAG